MDEKEIQKLAELARITITEEEAVQLKEEIGSILEYVSELSGVAVGHSSDLLTPAVHVDGLLNVMRDDENPHESGLYTEALLAEAPGRQGDHIQVKKILGS